jgi:transcriptional repressor NrdR
MPLIMYCPFCNTEETKVIDSRLVGQGAHVRRRRECCRCTERFTTYEMPELTLPRVIKRDGRRVAFDEQKLRNGIHRALEKRPVSTEKIDELVLNIIHQLHTCGEREIDSLLLGEWVMKGLRNLDEVAYVRFASVYRRFQDLNAFREEIQRMEDKKTE